MTQEAYYNWRKVWEFTSEAPVHRIIVQDTVAIETIHLDGTESGTYWDAVWGCTLKLGTILDVPALCRLEIPLWSLRTAPDLRVPVVFKSDETLCAQVCGTLLDETIVLNFMGRSVR